MKKLTKRQAKALYNKGKDVVLVPSKCSPLSQFAGTFKLKPEDPEDFEKLINAFSYYNCGYKETGLRVNYFAP